MNSYKVAYRFSNLKWGKGVGRAQVWWTAWRLARRNTLAIWFWGGIWRWRLRASANQWTLAPVKEGTCDGKCERRAANPPASQTRNRKRRLKIPPFSTFSCLRKLLLLLSHRGTTPHVCMHLSFTLRYLLLNVKNKGKVSAGVKYASHPPHQVNFLLAPSLAVLFNALILLIRAIRKLGTNCLKGCFSICEPPRQVRFSETT